MKRFLVNELAKVEGFMKTLNLFLGFSEHYNCPHIVISTVGATSWVSKLTNNPSPTSYVPHFFLDLTDRMSLLERLQNTIFSFLEDTLLNLFFYGEQQKIYETAFPTSENFRPFWDKVKHGISMVRNFIQYLRLHQFSILRLGIFKQPLLLELPTPLLPQLGNFHS
jgi:hypothetical protein